MPLLPSRIPAQVCATVLAKGVTAPNPVMTTRRLLTIVYRKKFNWEMKLTYKNAVDEPDVHPHARLLKDEK
jgi:hypothetical protein